MMNLYEFKRNKKQEKRKLFKIVCTGMLISAVNPVNALADTNIKELPGDAYRIDTTYNGQFYVQAISKQQLNELLNTDEEFVTIDTDREIKISKEELQNALLNAKSEMPPLYLTIISGVVFVFIVGSGVYGLICDREKEKTLK